MTGVVRLVRLALRRDRVRIPLWIYALAGTTVLTAVSFRSVFPTDADREKFAASVAGNAAFRALYGPTYDLSTIGGLTAWRLGAAMALLAGLMSLLLVVRHTRSEEEAGRVELMRSGAVSPLAVPLASLIVVALTNLVVAVVCTAGLVACGQSVAGSVAFGAATGLSGLSFATLGLLTAQIASSGRSAAGLAGGVLGGSFVIRILGDAAQVDALTWISPNGWFQHVQVFAGNRWWVLLLPLTFSIVCGGVAFALAQRRDVNAGLWREREGAARAPRSVRGVWGLAWRLQRTTVVCWVVGMAAGGAVMGGIGKDLGEVAQTTDAFREAFERLGGPGAVIDSFFAAMLTLLGVMAAGFAVSSVRRLHVEEDASAAEVVLSASVGRTRWTASHLSIAALGTVVLLVVAGVVMGTADALRTGDASQVARITWAAVVQVPAALVFAALTFVAFGVRSRFSTLGWFAFGAVLFVTEMGAALQLSHWILDISPFQHVPNTLLPASGRASWLGECMLLGVAASSVAVGALCFRRRDLS
jgi:ABC-2 type transport system permease protein